MLSCLRFFKEEESYQLTVETIQPIYQAIMANNKFLSEFKQRLQSFLAFTPVSRNFEYHSRFLICSAPNWEVHALNHTYHFNNRSMNDILNYTTCSESDIQKGCSLGLTLKQVRAVIQFWRSIEDEVKEIEEDIQPSCPIEAENQSTVTHSL